MSIQSLLESANNFKSQQSDAARLSEKWEKTGLLEGLEGSNKTNMGVILENQAKQLVVEASSTNSGGASFTAGDGAQWAGVALPLVRKVFGQIAAQEFVSVQPMNLPSGLVFYLDFQYGTTKDGFTSGNSLYGDVSGFASNSTSGGLYGAGRFSYSINTTGSAVINSSTVSGSATWSDLNFDSDYSASAVAGDYRTITIADTALTEPDTEAVRGFRLKDSVGLSVAEDAFTRRNAADNSTIFVVSASYIAGDENITIDYSQQTKDNNRGDFEDGNTGLNGGNNPISIPEINVQMKSSAIVAKTRKLKAVWTPEFAQDLNAYHSIDAEAELTSMLSEYISLEIDLEILDMLRSNALTTEYWSAVIGEEYDGTGGWTAPNSAVAYQKNTWFQTLGTKLNKVSNKIHQLTLRGGANFIVASPDVCTILESIPAFSVNADKDAGQFAAGVSQVGSLANRYTVYKNPYQTNNEILLGFKGSNFLETGAVYAPYVPLIMTPLVYDPANFTPRRGVMTRYAKKMVRPEFYGKVYIKGIDAI